MACGHASSSRLASAAGWAARYPRSKSGRATALSASTAGPRVAIQGELGSFSHEAAIRLFGKDLDLVACETFPDVFRAAGRHGADFAVLPVENALYGSIHQNYDLLVEHRPDIWAEIRLRIELCLVGRIAGPVRRGGRVLVHPVAQGQCTAFLRRHRLEPVPAHDTAGAIRLLVEGADCDYAIASRLAARTHGARVLARGIEDDPRNFTRFLAFSAAGRRKDPFPGRGGPWKTSLAFVLPNRPGTLFKALGAFALRDIDLAKIESRPIRGRPFEYLFYLDAAGSLDEPPLAKAVDHLREIVETLWVLGSYRRID